MPEPSDATLIIAETLSYSDHGLSEALVPFIATGYEPPVLNSLAVTLTQKTFPGRDNGRRRVRHTKKRVAAQG